MSTFPTNPSPHPHPLAARLIPGATRTYPGRAVPGKNRACINPPQHSYTLAPLRTAWEERSKSGEAPPSGTGTKNVLIVGGGQLGRRIEQYLAKHPEKRMSVCAFLDDKAPIGNGIAGRTEQLAEVARAYFVDEVILALPQDRERTLRILNEARRLRLDVKVATDLFGCQAIESQNLAGMALISVHEEKFPLAELWFKRVIDVTVAAAGLLLLAPALLLIALLIKLGSCGPVLYVAPRAGRKGHPFACYKFRTMVAEADRLKDILRSRNQRSGPFFKIKDDPRITHFGRFLRRYSLDELPQLWNVLRGDMSLVGPRPHPLDDVSGYAMEHLPRLDVTPGLTGLWQVTARTNPSFETGVDLDLAYIDGWSLGMDLRILWKTAGAVLRGSGE